MRVPRKTSEHLYPTGERNFVRTAAAGHLTATAMAQFAKQKGVKRLFLSWNGNHVLGRIRRRRGKRSKVPGIQIAGAAPFNPEARNYARFARRIAATRADGVVLAAYAFPSTPALLRDLRAGLGPRVTLIGSEGYLVPDFLHVAGPAALGMYIAFPGADISLLPPAGKRFLKELKARTGKPGEFYTAYAAQSAEILLDAIARSDGTRASVTKELFKTRVENGILGNIRFDKNGDPVEAPITIWHIVRHPRGPYGRRRPSHPRPSGTASLRALLALLSGRSTFAPHRLHDYCTGPDGLQPAGYSRYGDVTSAGRPSRKWTTERTPSAPGSSLPLRSPRATRSASGGAVVE